MPPKAYRTNSTSHLRTHSRNTSANKLGANLQFTQQNLTGKAEKTKKNVLHEPQTKASQYSRVHNARTLSREQLPVYLPQKRTTLRPKNGAKSKPGFTIATADDEDEDEEWISSESGAATPNLHDSDDSDRADSPTTPIEHPSTPVVAQIPRNTLQPNQMTAVRIPDRPAVPITRGGFREEDTDESATPLQKPVALPVVQPIQPVNQASSQRRQPTAEPSVIPPLKQVAFPMPQPPAKTVNSASYNHQRHHTSDLSELQPSVQLPPSPQHKRQSATTRPPSMHSISSRSDAHVPLRPHPLIRGLSFGQPMVKTPLAPLTDVTPLNSPPRNDYNMKLSPDSISPTLSSRPNSIVSLSSTSMSRRTSISSARSVSTLPVQLPPKDSRSIFDRARTMSSSSAALSSLTHLPTVSHPPTPQLVSYFPIVNPHAKIEEIHPLLPTPYLATHLTTLAHRTPLRESYDRIMKVKTGK